MDEDQDDLDLPEDADDLPKSAAVQSLPALVAPLLSLIQPTPLSFPPTDAGVSPHPPTTSALSAIHICALECLNNIFLSIASPADGGSLAAGPEREHGAQIWGAIWAALQAVGTDVNGPGQERRREMWAVAVGVLWGVANAWKGVLVSASSIVVMPRPNGLLIETYLFLA